MESHAHPAQQASPPSPHRPPILVSTLRGRPMHMPLVVLYALSAVLALAFVWRFVHFFRGLKRDARGTVEQ